MEDDFISGLTRQVKEEVIENYIRERRLLELQIEQLQKQAEQTRGQAERAAGPLARLGFLMVGPGMVAKLKEILKLANDDFWAARLTGMPPGTCSFQTRGFTRKGRFRKLVVLSYRDLTAEMNAYRKLHEDLAGECAAVNMNICTFHRNFDLLAILNFFRTLDVQSLERKNILGENFTAREMAELDRNLYIRPMIFEKLGIPSPIRLPALRDVEQQFLELANEVYKRYGTEVERML